MSINSYPQNTAVRFTGLFYNIVGALTDPTTVLFQTAGPDGVSYSFPAVRDGVGMYHYDFTTATPAGKWYYRFQGMGALIVQSSDVAYIVQPKQF